MICFVILGSVPLLEALVSYARKKLSKVFLLIRFGKCSLFWEESQTPRWEMFRQPVHASSNSSSWQRFLQAIKLGFQKNIKLTSERLRLHLSLVPSLTLSNFDVKEEVWLHAGTLPELHRLRNQNSRV